MKIIKLIIIILLGLSFSSGFSQTQASFFTQAKTRESSLTWYYFNALEMTGGIGFFGVSAATLYLGLKELGPFAIGTSLLELNVLQDRIGEFSILPLYFYYPIVKGKTPDGLSKRSPWFVSVFTGGALFAENPDKTDDQARRYFKLGITSGADFLKYFSAILEAGLTVGRTFGKENYSALFLTLSIGVNPPNIPRF